MINSSEKNSIFVYGPYPTGTDMGGKFAIVLASLDIHGSKVITISTNKY